MPPPAPIFWEKIDENQVSYFIWPSIAILHYDLVPQRFRSADPSRDMAIFLLTTTTTTTTTTQLITLPLAHARDKNFSITDITCIRVKNCLCASRCWELPAMMDP